MLNPDSGERVGLGITTLLTVVAIFFVAHDAIPKVGHWTMLSGECGRVSFSVLIQCSPTHPRLQSFFNALVMTNISLA